MILKRQQRNKKGQVDEDIKEIRDDLIPDICSDLENA